MRRKKRTTTMNGEPQLDISSLIDVCFLLLIYFIVTSIIAPSEKDLPMTIPGWSGGLDADTNIVFLGIRGNGDILMNPGSGEEVLDTNPDDRKIPLVSERLEMMQSMAQAGGSELIVKITAYEGVEQQRFIDVLNCLRSHGVNTVMISDFDEGE